MKIVILNSHSSMNLGDAAILGTTVEALQVELPGSTFVVMSDTPERDRAAYPGLEVLGVAYPWVGRGALGGAVAAVWFHTRFWLDVLRRRLVRRAASWSFLPPDAARVLDAIVRADLVVSCGGGYVSSLGKLHTRMFAMLAAAWLGKRTVFYSQSVSDLHSRAHEALVVRTINRSDAFVARERRTYDLLVRLGVEPVKLHLAADSAFLLRARESEAARQVFAGTPPGRRRLGMTVTRWSFPGRRDPRARAASYVEAVRALAQHATERRGFELFVLPQVFGPSPYTDDRNLAREVFGPLAGRGVSGGPGDGGARSGRIHLVELELSPAELKWLIAQMDVFVGTRMHSNVFALGARVPTLAVAYQEKTQGIMEMLGLEHWVIDISAIDGRGLVERFEELWSLRAPVRAHLERVLPGIEESARASARICREVLTACRETPSADDAVAIDRDTARGDGAAGGDQGGAANEANGAPGQK